MTARVLLLDVMSTLVHDPIFDAAPAHFGCDARTLLSSLDRDVWLAFERGEIDEERYYRTCFRDRREVDGAAFRAAMVGGYAWLPGIEQLLDELRGAGVAMHALSNYPIWWRHIEAKLGLGRYLSWRFVSCEMGVRKPDAEAFLGPAAALGVPPEALVFVDDQVGNVEAAAALGLDAIRFTGAADLRGALEERGVFAPRPGG